MAGPFIDGVTPIAAEPFNQFWADITEVRAEAIAARDAAQAAAEEAAAPADDQVATLVDEPESQTRAQLDATYGSRQAASDAAYIGRWGTLSTDPASAAANSALIALALSQSSVVRLPAGTFYIDSTIMLAGPKKLYGAGSRATILTSTDPDLTSVRCSGGEGTTVAGLTITKDVAAYPTTAASRGIDFGVTQSGGYINDVVVTRHGVGLYLGGTGLSRAENITVQWNFSHGVFMSNAVSTVNSLQWYLLNVGASGNGGDGFRIQSTDGKGSCSFGKLVSCYTYANTGRGCIVFAPGTPDRINSFRMSDCFFGEDGGDELYLNSFGGNHQITGSFFELSGVSTTGPGKWAQSGSTALAPASHVGHGLNISANNDGVLVGDCQFVQASLNGLVSGATRLAVNNCMFNSNGHAGTSGSNYGCNIASGSAVITGNTAWNATGVTQQQKGFRFGVTDVTFVANDLRNNVTSGFDGSTPAVNLGNRT